MSDRHRKNGVMGFAFVPIAMALLVSLCVTAGCAKTTVTARKSYAESEQLPRPERIVVYDFAATPEDLPADDPIRRLNERHAKHQTAAEVRLGRKLGAEIARDLVEEIRNLGMRAERSKNGRIPEAGDLVIKGALVYIHEGDRLKRVLIGFGAGARELKTIVEIYQTTAEGPRPLITEEIKATGGKLPGMLFTVAAAIATGPVGVSAGAAASAGTVGAAGQAAAVSGGVNVAKEIGPESLEAAAKGTAKEIAKALSQIFTRHGWIK